MEERSAAKKLKRDLEMKKKETDEEASKSKLNDDEVELSKKNLKKEREDNNETKRGAPKLTDSFHPQDSNLTSVQEDSTTKAMDETEERLEKDSTTKAMDETEGVDGTQGHPVKSTT